jgi:DNA-binding protein YbaB
VGLVDVEASESLTALVERARAAIAGMQQPPAGRPLVGEAADGQVRAEIGADGRLRTLAVDPTMLREPLADVCADIITAVNAALDARPDRIGTGPLLAELKAVQEQSAQEMAKISDAFSDALNRALAR